MTLDVITKADLEKFKEDLFEKLELLLRTKFNPHYDKRWMKSAEVMQLMKISAGTLQTLRDKGDIPYTKLGGSIYYDALKINEILEGKDADSDAP